MKNVNYKKLRRYDIGKRPSYIGYQPGVGVNTSGFSSTPQYDMSSQVSEQQRAIVPTAISGALNLGGTGYQIFSNYITPKAAEKATQAAASTGVGTATKAGLTALGKIAAGAGALYGGLNIANDIVGYSDRLRGDDLQNMSSTNTQSKYGVNYTTYGGFDEQGVRDYTHAQNTASTLSLALNGAGTGMSIGSFFGPIGAGIGAGVGALGGWLGGLLGFGKSRKRAVEKAITDTKRMQGLYNLQAESEAASQGLQNQFYNGFTADRGRDAKVGIENANGLASPDETVQDMTTGETQYLGSPSPNVKDPRKDVIPVNVGDMDAIAGHDVDLALERITGERRTFADQAASYAKENERIKSMMDKVENGDGDAATKKRNIENLENMYKRNSDEIRNIMNRQSMQHYSCGKTPTARFDRGLGVHPAYSFLSGLPYALQEQIAVNREVPYAQNSYVPNASADSALGILGSLRYNPTNALNAVTNAHRQSLYDINQAGNLSSAQRTMLRSDANAKYGKNRAAVYNAAQETNNKYLADYAEKLLSSGEQAANRQQQALATQQEAYRQAVGAKQKWAAQARKNWYTIGRQGVQDWNSYILNGRQYDLWNKEVNAKLYDNNKKNKAMTYNPIPTDYADFRDRVIFPQ